jgi:hypothetical protein
MNTLLGALTAALLGFSFVGPASAEIYQKWGGSSVRSNGTSLSESQKSITGTFSSRQETVDSASYTLLPDCNCTGTGGAQSGTQTTTINKLVEESQQWTEQVRNSTNLTIQAEDWSEFRFIGSGSIFN